MKESPPKVITIPAKPEIASRQAVQRQLRVAAYCRVSTDDEEQLTSYEAQQNYYTDKIMTNREWTMAGIFADEGITGTSARKRPEFLKMIRLCKQKKIDIVLTKSISRFARNTVDCLNYIRALRELGIAVIFEKENINTLEADSEILITMLGAFAQAESESISAKLYFVPRDKMHKVDLFEDFLEELNRANQNEKALVVNSFYVADDEKQREKMASEFYTLVRKEAQEYQERAMYLIDSGCQSPSIMERWIGRIDDLKQKKQRYEALFRKELSETDAEFDSLQLYSQELQIRADGIRMQRAA